MHPKFFRPLLYGHKEHRKGLLFSCTAAMCLFKLPLLPHLYWHKEHSEGFFFSCTAAICLFKSPICPNLYGHKEQRMYLFFSCTAAMCLVLLTTKFLELIPAVKSIMKYLNLQDFKLWWFQTLIVWPLMLQLSLVWVSYFLSKLVWSYCDF